MSFSQWLRKEADHLYEAVYEHPFVQGIAKGDLSTERLIHYVKQDFTYLTTFTRVYGIAISKCTRREDIAYFHKQIEFVLNDESHPHHNFCRVAGVTYESLQGSENSPTAVNYMQHMLNAAQFGSIAEIIATLLPCPWIYAEIGQRIAREFHPDESHPFHEWISFYDGGTIMELTEYFCAWLDRLAADVSAADKVHMQQLFNRSCQFEYMFFDMAYRIEEWPVAAEVQAV